jgi:diadenosine tetraphosphate (Ap4A) HIT family hydrolase
MFRFARSPLGRWLVGWIFAHMSFALPVHRLRETGTLMAFYHPQPAYAFHVLIVPKRSIARLTALSLDDSDFMVELFQTVQSLVAEFELEARGYRLIANGGKYQDIPLLHFHLIAE